MKKFLIILLALLFTAFVKTSAHDVYPDMPHWCEFCPKNYLDVQANVSYHMPEKQYWAERKLSFEHSKHFCVNNYSYDLDKMGECFASLRSSEKRKTQEFLRAQKYKSLNPIYP